MTTLATNIPPISKEPPVQVNWVKRLVLFVVFLICEVAIFILGSNYFEIFPTNKNLTYNLVICAVFLAAALWFKRTERLNVYWRVTYAFFVASMAYPTTWFTIDWVNRLIGRFSLTPDTTQGMAVAKLIEVILVTVPIIVLTKLSGADLGSIFLKRGNLKLGLGVGGLVFVFLSTAAFMFAAQRFTTMEALGAAVVWGLVFSFANGLMEELWLRGIFLKHFERFLGAHSSVWLTAIVFALLHGFAFYFMPEALPFFLLNTLSLGLACGYLMMKTDSIWGAVLIHAASDFFLFIAVLANA